MSPWALVVGQRCTVREVQTCTQEWMTVKRKNLVASNNAVTEKITSFLDNITYFVNFLRFWFSWIDTGAQKRSLPWLHGFRWFCTQFQLFIIFVHVSRIRIVQGKDMLLPKKTSFNISNLEAVQQKNITLLFLLEIVNGAERRKLTDKECVMWVKCEKVNE